MKDTIREQWLDDKGYTWDYLQQVVLADIRIDEGVRRQIRLSDEIDQDHVGRLVHALNDGAQLPAVILAKIDGKLELVDGIHRVTALQHKSIPTTDAYLLTNIKDRTQLEQARRIANAPVGKGFSAEEAVQQAVALVTRANWAPKEAAKAMSVAHEAVSRRLRVVVTDSRLSKIRPKANLSALNIQSRDFLGRIQNDDILGECLDTAIERKMSTSMIEEGFADALSITTDAQAAVFRAKMKEAYPDEKRPRFPSVEHTAEHNYERTISKIRRSILGLDKCASFNAQLDQVKRQAVATELQRIGADLLSRATSLSLHGDIAPAERKRGTRQSGRSKAAHSAVRTAGKGGASVS